MFDWQLILVCVLLAGALAYIGRQTWRTWTGRGGGCSGKCGCGKPSENDRQPRQIPLIPSEQLTLRK